MAKPKRNWLRNETRQRQKLVGVRLNRSEYGALARTAAREGKSPPSVLREAFLRTLPPMTADEFEAGYAARSGVTVKFLHRTGRYAEPCHCGEPECKGWALGHPWEDAIVEDQLRSQSSR